MERGLRAMLGLQKKGPHSLLKAFRGYGESRGHWLLSAAELLLSHRGGRSASRSDWGG